MNRSGSSFDLLVNLSDTVFVSQRASTLFTLVSNTQSTSVLWALAEIEGGSSSSVSRSQRADLETLEDLILDPSVNPTPTIRKVSNIRRRESLTSREWIRVAIARDPYERLYAAWERNVLLGRLGVLPSGEDALPRPVETIAGLDVSASFAAFVRHLSEHHERWLSTWEFGTQTSQIRVDEVAYTDLISPAEIPAFIERLGRRAGIAVEPRRTESLLGLDWQATIQPATAAIIENLYADDFALLGLGNRPTWNPRPVMLDPAAARLRQEILDRSERMRLLGSRSAEGSQLAPEPTRRRTGWRI